MGRVGFFLGCGAVALVAIGAQACNSILGIEEPTEVTPEGVPTSMATEIPDAGAAPHKDAGEAGTVGSVSDASANAHAWADWPMPNPAEMDALPNPQTYDTTSVDGVVADSVTGLKWQRDVDTQTHTWPEAEQYCAKLGLAGGGWRVPSRIELVSLVDFTRSSPVIDADAFPSTPAERFWTSSLSAADPANGWTVNFGFNADIVQTSDVGNPYRVRCVR
jgi:hypothetical protein